MAKKHIKQVIDYLATLEPNDLHAVIGIMAGKIHPNVGGDGCTSDKCHGNIGCTPGSQNGYCACVNNVCRWIPAV